MSYIQVLECTWENTLSEDKNDNNVLYLFQVLECTGENTLSEDENDNIGSFGIPELSVQLTEAGFGIQNIQYMELYNVYD